MTDPVARSGPRVLYEGDAVILGETRLDVGADVFRREGVAGVWPSIAFPRTPMGIRHADADPVLGDANRALLFSVGRPYRRISIDGHGSWTEWIEVRPDLLDEMLAACAPARTSHTVSPFRSGGAPAPARAYLAHRRLRRALAASHPADPIGLEEGALVIAGEVVAAGFAIPATRAHPARRLGAHDPREVVFAVQALLNQRLDEPLTLSEISQAVKVSPYHLSRVFRAETGLPIHRYRDRLRLRASLERIADRSARMLDIALDLGYSSEGHFSEAFRRVFGVRPSVARRSLTGALRALPPAWAARGRH